MPLNQLSPIGVDRDAHCLARFRRPALYKRSSMNKYIAPFLRVDHAQLTQFSPVMPRHMNQTPIAHLAAHLGIQSRAINNNIQYVRFFAWEYGFNYRFRFYK